MSLLELANAANTAARSLDTLIDRLKKVAEAKPAPGGGGGATGDADLDRRLADAIHHRGQVPETLDALKRHLR